MWPIVDFFCRRCKRFDKRVDKMKERGNAYRDEIVGWYKKDFSVKATNSEMEDMSQFFSLLNYWPFVWF